MFGYVWHNMLGMFCQAWNLVPKRNDLKATFSICQNNQKMQSFAQLSMETLSKIKMFFTLCKSIKIHKYVVFDSVIVGTMLFWKV